MVAREPLAALGCTRVHDGRTPFLEWLREGYSTDNVEKLAVMIELIGGLPKHLNDLQPLSKVLVSLTMLRSEEHTSELQSLMRISYAVFCLKKKTKTHKSES